MANKIHPETALLATSLFDTLPPNARKYYRAPNENSDSIQEIVHHTTSAENFSLLMGLFFIYPLFRIRYLAANQIMVVLKDGEHQVLIGPGLKWYVRKSISSLM